MSFGIGAFPFGIFASAFNFNDGRPGPRKFSFINMDIVNTIVNAFNPRSSVVECLSRDRGAAGSSLTGVTALWSLSKTPLS